MYIDKPMRGHGLMQAIARVNRVFRDKPGGLVVDYIGIAAELKEALSTYSARGRQGRAQPRHRRGDRRDAAPLRDLSATSSSTRPRRRAWSRGSTTGRS